MKQEELLSQQIQSNRSFMKSGFGKVKFESDQQKGLTQPPLSKPAVSKDIIQLPREFSEVLQEANYLTLLQERRSHRSYRKEPLSLTQLAFLLWSTQGVKSIRGDHYATIRTVPSAGARHSFETYLAIFNVDGLDKGLYHYLPLDHTLEFLSSGDHLEESVGESLCQQHWAVKGAAVFFYSAVPYRTEWRYSAGSHRVMMLDAGHVMQNLYLSSEAIGCGTCAIAAFDQAAVDQLFQLDGDNEFIVYAAPVGII